MKNSSFLYLEKCAHLSKFFKLRLRFTPNGNQPLGFVSRRSVIVQLKPGLH